MSGGAREERRRRTSGYVVSINGLCVPQVRRERALNSDARSRMAERVGFVPVVPSPINDLGLIPSSSSHAPFYDTMSLSLRPESVTSL